LRHPYGISIFTFRGTQTEMQVQRIAARLRYFGRGLRLFSGVPLNKETRSFQAETKRLLEIMAESLYTDKEIFIRELISNASDACEKLRYLQSTNQVEVEGDLDFKIEIEADPEKGTLTIRDNGIGMSSEDLIQYLGTICHSGSKAFLTEVESGQASADNIIGQFGVGFYSVFMVADKVEVFSKSAKGGLGHYWASDGSGQYEIAQVDGVNRGTTIVIHLNSECKQFSKPRTIHRVAKKHSNFVGFPLFVDGTEMKSLGAVWMKNKNEVSEEDHKEFYKHLTNSHQSPRFHMHFHADVPLAIHALFYFPDTHLEKFGLGRLDPGVSLYSRKVLIQANSDSILPQWMRFIKGVVDSEDIPLNISRETMQDSALINKIKNALTKKIINFLIDMSEKEPEKYMDFYKEFSMFIREGAATDYANKDQIARLLRYETLNSGASSYKSLDEYISQMSPSQKNIYYVHAPTRAHAENSPYIEAFKNANIDVLFLYSQADEMVMAALAEFEGRKLLSVENTEAEVNNTLAGNYEEAKLGDSVSQWMGKSLSHLVQSVKPSKRVMNVPAIVVNEDTSALRRMQIVMEMQGEEFQVPAQQLEINAKHPIIVGLNTLRASNPDLAIKIAEQVYDNALISAGLMRDGRAMVGRLNDLLSNLTQNLEESQAAAKSTKEANSKTDSVNAEQ
jgi:HSP90 family molecular chaperone